MGKPHRAIRTEDIEIDTRVISNRHGSELHEGCEKHGDCCQMCNISRMKVVPIADLVGKDAGRGKLTSLPSPPAKEGIENWVVFVAAS